jgi:hypothetical protein
MTETTETQETAQKLAKSVTIGLRAGASRMRLVAHRRRDGSARTFCAVTTDKKTTRGMSAMHESFQEATVHLAVLAEKAEKLGWSRGAAGGYSAKPDAFSVMPTAPNGVQLHPAKKGAK